MGQNVQILAHRHRLDAKKRLHGFQTLYLEGLEAGPQFKLIPPFPWAVNSSVYAIVGNFVHGELNGIAKLFISQDRGIFAQVKDGYMHGGVTAYGQLPVLPVMKCFFFFSEEMI